MQTSRLFLVIRLACLIGNAFCSAESFNQLLELKSGHDNYGSKIHDAFDRLKEHNLTLVKRIQEVMQDTTSEPQWSKVCLIPSF